MFRPHQLFHHGQIRAAMNGKANDTQNVTLTSQRVTVASVLLISSSPGYQFAYQRTDVVYPVHVA
jgi:hypothetical protein